MEKICCGFSQDIRNFGDFRPAIVAEFIKACPPIDISRLVNARQFQEFLFTRWEARSEPPYLRDVAACELAIAEVRVCIRRTGIGGGERAEEHTAPTHSPPPRRCSPPLRL